MMQYVYGALAGLVWGALAALLNRAISRAALKKNSGGAVMGANVARLAVDLAALGAVYLLRRRLPFSFEAAIIATAVALSILNIVFTYQSIRPEK